LKLTRGFYFIFSDIDRSNRRITRDWRRRSTPTRIRRQGSPRCRRVRLPEPDQRSPRSFSRRRRRKGSGHYQGGRKNNLDNLIDSFPLRLTLGLWKERGNGNLISFLKYNLLCCCNIGSMVPVPSLAGARPLQNEYHIWMTCHRPGSSLARIVKALAWGSHLHANLLQLGTGIHDEIEGSLRCICMQYITTIAHSKSYCY
jgi:hypothetical protein